MAEKLRFSLLWGRDGSSMPQGIARRGARDYGGKAALFPPLGRDGSSMPQGIARRGASGYDGKAVLFPPLGARDQWHAGGDCEARRRLDLSCDILLTPLEKPFFMKTSGVNPLEITFFSKTSGVNFHYIPVQLY